MATDLPPLAPPPLKYATPVTGRSDLRSIAGRQRAIMYCILAEIVMIALVFVAPYPWNFPAAFAFLAVLITGAVFTFSLALAVYSTGMGIVMGIGSLVPYLGILFLLVVNSKATKILRAHQIHVGLLGANLSQIPDPGQIHV